MDTPAYEYTTFPLRFDRYRWFKPLLVALLTAIFTLIIQMAIAFGIVIWIGKGFDVAMQSIDRSSPYFFTGPGELLAIGGIAALLPSLALAVRIVHDRPFASYSSSRGGWDWAVFLKCLGVAAVVFGGTITLQAVLFPEPGADGVNHFNAVGLLLCLILVPIQAASEEYVFRGLIMQAFGSWTKLPALAMVVSSLLFMAAHTYMIFGTLGVLCHGLVYAFLTWYSKGLEAGSAAHIANNLSVFLLSGFGLATTREGGPESLVVVIVMGLVYLAAIVTLDKNLDWFRPRRDTAAEFNERFGTRGKHMAR